MGNTNSDFQQDFVHWKKLGNETAVEALQNSDLLNWYQLEQKLKKAIYYYD